MEKTRKNSINEPIRSSYSHVRYAVDCDLKYRSLTTTGDHQLDLFGNTRIDTVRTESVLNVPDSGDSTRERIRRDTRIRSCATDKPFVFRRGHRCRRRWFLPRARVVENVRAALAARIPKQFSPPPSCRRHHPCRRSFGKPKSKLYRS